MTRLKIKTAEGVCLIHQYFESMKEACEYLREKVEGYSAEVGTREITIDIVIK